MSQKNHARGSGSAPAYANDGADGMEETPLPPAKGDSTALAPVVDQDYFESTGEIEKAPGAAAKTPWIGLFGEKTKNGREALVAAGVEINQFYLFDEAGPLRVKPFQFHLLKSARYYTKQDSLGRTIAATKENPYAKDPKTKFKEHQIALVVVAVKGTHGETQMIPATWSLRSGVVKALRTALNLTFAGDSKTPAGLAHNKEAWAARSPQHAISAQARFPGGRFVVTAWATTETGKPNDDGETFDYNLGHSTIAPTTVEGVTAFNKLMQDEFVTRIVPAVSSWEWRCKQIEKLIGGAK